MEEDDPRVYDLLRAKKEKELSALKRLRKVNKALETPSYWTKLSANLCVKKSWLDRGSGGRRKSRKFSDNIGWDGLKYERGTRPDRVEAVSKMQQKQRNELSELREMGLVKEKLRRRRKKVCDDAKVLFDGARRPYNLTKQANVLVNCREPEREEAVAQFVKQTSHAFVEAFFGVPSQSQRVLERLTAPKREALEKTLKKRPFHKRRQARPSDWELGYREREDSATADTPVTERPRKVRFRTRRLETDLPGSTITFSTSREVNGHLHIPLPVETPDDVISPLSEVSTDDTPASGPSTPASTPGWDNQALECDLMHTVVSEEKERYVEALGSNTGAGSDWTGVMQSSTAPVTAAESSLPNSPVVLLCSQSRPESECSDELRCYPSFPRGNSIRNQREPGFGRGTETSSDHDKDPTPQEDVSLLESRGLFPAQESGSDSAHQQERSYHPLAMVSDGDFPFPTSSPQLQPVSPKDEQLFSHHHDHKLTSTSIEVSDGDRSYQTQYTELDCVFGQVSSTEVLDGADEDDRSSSSGSSTNLCRCVSSPLFSDTSALNTPFSEGFASSSPFSWNGVNPEATNLATMLRRRRSQKSPSRDSGSASEDLGRRGKSSRLPTSARNNPKFVQFCKDLQISNPTCDDYTAFKLRQLGDDIESKHEGLLEVILQKAVIYAMQEKLSFQRFSKLSRELAFQAHRAQERTLLVACFGRRLWEKLPEYQDSISQFTALSVEEVACDFFLSMGLSQDVNHYDPEICSDYDDWRDVLERLHSKDDDFPELLSEEPYFEMPLEEPPSYATIPRGFNSPGSRLGSISTDNETKMAAAPAETELSRLQLPGFHLRRATSVEVLLAVSDSENDRGRDDQPAPPVRANTDPSDERPSPSQLVKVRHETVEETDTVHIAVPSGWSTRHRTSSLTDVRTFGYGGHALEELDRGQSSSSEARPVVITSLMHQFRSTTSSVAQSVRTVGSVPSQSEAFEFACVEEEFTVCNVRPQCGTPEFPSTFTSTSSSPDGEIDDPLHERRDVLIDRDAVSGSPSSRNGSAHPPSRQRRRSSLQLVADAVVPLAPAISALVIAFIVKSRTS